MGIIRKLTAITANLSLLLNSFLPFILAIQPVYAQSSEGTVPEIVEVVNLEPVNAEPVEAPTPEQNNSEPPETPTEAPVETPTEAPVETPTPITQPSTTPEITPTTEPQLEIDQPLVETPTPFEEPTPTLELENNEQVEPSPIPTQFDGEPIEATPTPINSEIGTLIPDIQITPTPNSKPVEVPTPTDIPTYEKICLTDEQIRDTTNEEWVIDDSTQTSETKNNVQLGIRYVYPQDNKVSVIFKCLPKDETLRTPLKIQQIKTSELGIPDTSSMGEYAYDINTGMTDGDFSYDLTLPKPENSTAEITYIEKTLDEAKLNVEFYDLKKIEESKTEQQTDVVKAVSIDHFTIYFTAFSKDSSIKVPEILSFVTEPITDDNGMCIENAAGEFLNCTANDVSISNVTNVVIKEGDSCEYIGDTVTFTANWEVQSNSIKRYDVGLYFATKGQSNARTGVCSVSTLPNSPSPPWFDYDLDSCGDINSSSTVNPIITITAVCLDPDGDNLLNLPYCTSWDNQAGSVCTGPSDAIPNTKSKCNCPIGGFTVPITVPYVASIEVIKDLNPSSDLGKFNLQIDDKTEKNDAGDNESTGPVSVGAGTNDNPGAIHTVGEIAGSGTTLDNYNSSISCVNRGLTTYHGGLPLTINGTGPLNVPVIKDDDIVCTITNNRKSGSLEIKKDVVPDDSNTQWLISVTGLSPFTDILVGDDSTGNRYSATGIYSINESAGNNTSQNDYVSTYNCTKNSSPYLSGSGTNISDINITDEDTVVCTFTNTRKYSHLTVIKTVVNNNGGKLLVSDFPLFINSTSVVSGISNEIEPGTYTVSETNKTGYTPSVWGGDCAEDGTITLLPGDNKTCTITNDDVAPTLTLVKKITNDNGGDAAITDFTLKADDIVFTSSVSQNVVANEPYTLSETGPTGYTPSAWICTGGTQDGSNITLTEGQSAICEITNDDVAPTLTLVKKVYNDNGGTAKASDFGIIMGIDWVYDTLINFDNGILVPSSPSNEREYTRYVSSPNPTVLANANYYLKENDLPGYIEGSWSCVDNNSGSVIGHNALKLSPGQNVTCTISNDDNYGRIIVDKVTIPTGEDQSFDFTLTGGHDSINQTFNLTDSATPYNSGPILPSDIQAGMKKYYNISENLPVGWDMSNTICNNGDPVNKIELSSQGTVTCTFTNIKRGSVSGTKYEDIDGNGNRNGLESGLSGWTIKLYNETGNGELATTITDSKGEYNFANIFPGNYQVCEIVTETGWTNTDPGAGEVDTACKQITVLAGQNTPADFGNFKLGEIKVCKYTDYTGNGTYQPGEDTPLANIDIKLSKYVDTSWLYNETLSTNADGCVIFKKLEAGKYKVEEDYSDSDLNGYYSTNDITYYDDIQISSGSIENRIFLNAKYRTIEGFKFNDFNGNGAWDAGETGIENWTIFIDYNNNGTLNVGETTVTTDEFGHYKFTNLVSDSYLIAEKLETEWTQTYPLAGHYNIDLHTEISSADNNFGNVQLSDIHGYKWNDLNGNKIEDTDEPRLSGWEIFIDKNDDSIWNEGEPKTVTSSNPDPDHFGWYWFENLLPGTYKVCETVQDDWFQTYPDPICHIISLPYNSQELERSVTNYLVEPAPSYNFGNIQYGSVEVTKFEDANGNKEFDEGEEKLDGWDINLSPQGSKTTGSQQMGQVLFDQLLPGTYNLSETIQPGWEQTIIYCHEFNPTPTATPTPIDGPNPTPTTTVTPTTTATPTPSEEDKINTCRYNSGRKEYNAISISPNAYHPEGENGDFLYYGSFPVNTSEADQWCQNNNPSITITPTPPGNPVLNHLFSVQSVIAQEVDNNIDNDNSHEISLTAGQNLICFIGNQRFEPKLTIAKSNNVSGNLSSGDQVEYTINLNIQDNDINNLKVTDLLSNGFKYKTGSYQVFLDDVDVTSSLGIPQPTYSSPGVWDLSKLGTLTPENKIRLTYIADISTDQQPGKYTDLAWAIADFAYDESESVLATAQPQGYVETNFVGTIVPIVKNTQNSVSAEVEQKVEGQVLGASTELPGTGASTIWLILSSILGFIGLGVLKFNKKRLFTLLFTLLSFGLITKPIFAADFVLSIQEPKTPTNTKDLKLEFKALHLNNGIITVKCFKKGPTDSDFSQFGSNIILTAGGNSAYCDLSLAINDNGSYQFNVEANDGVDTATKTVSLDYNTSTPGTPRDYRKENINSNNCDFKIHFRTDADGGKTVKVELYRSTDSAFSANIESLVHSVNIGSDQEYDILNSVPDCSKTYYYALRAFDSAGNGSGLIGDKITITTTTTTTETTIGSGTGGAIPIGSSNIPTEKDENSTDNVEGETPDASTSGETGQVLGTIKNTVTNFVGQHKFISTLIGIAVLSIIIYAIKKFRKNKKR